MSTTYYIGAADDERPTFEELQNLSKELGFVVGEMGNQGEVFCCEADETNYIWPEWDTYEGKQRMSDFTRFGGNNPDWFIDLLEGLGLEVISEHDT